MFLFQNSPVCPEFWYGLRPNSGEKKPPSVVTEKQLFLPMLIFYNIKSNGHNLGSVKPSLLLYVIKYLALISHYPDEP